MHLKRHKEWYKGDGWYGDGRNFHLDYYNSYVIQPMLIDVLSVMKKHEVEGADFYDVQLQRLIRYADQQEKMISPEGTYPVLGRSMDIVLGFSGISSSFLDEIITGTYQTSTGTLCID